MAASRTPDASRRASVASGLAVLLVLAVVGVAALIGSNIRTPNVTTSLAHEQGGSVDNGDGKQPATPSGDRAATVRSEQQMGARPSRTGGHAVADGPAGSGHTALTEQVAGLLAPGAVPGRAEAGGLSTLPLPGQAPRDDDPARHAETGAAHVVATNRVSPQVLDLTLYSPALGHNTGVRLLLPRDWSSEPGKHWPTLYMLPGYQYGYSYSMGDWTQWTNETGLEEFMADKNVLTVMPSTGGSGSFTDWWNRGDYGIPAWETYHTRELPAVLESAYGASDTRAIAGLSLGGYGAVEYAVENPGMYQGVASYSGVLHTKLPGIPALFQEMWRRSGVDPGQVWGDPYLQRGVWNANDPWYRASRLCGTGTSLFLSAGSGIPGAHDPSALQNAKDLLGSLPSNPEAYVNSYGQASLLETGSLVTTRSFASKLRAACGVRTATGLVTGDRGGVEITTDYTATGTHRWGYWEDAFRESWPTLANSLGVPVG